MAAEKFTFAATLGVSYEMYVGIEVENGVFVLLLIYLKKKNCCCCCCFCK